MKNLSMVICMIAVALLSATLNHGQKGAEVSKIDAYCKAVDAIQKRHKSPDLVFADVSDYERNEKEKWQKFASVKALDVFRKKTEVYSIAYNWQKGGKIVLSNLTLSSPSGDWAKYVYSYYREDGTLARVETDYRTFNGDFKVIRRRYFDASGKQISRNVKFLDLTTGKPKKANSGVMGDDPNEIDYYKKTSKLPFTKLIK